MIRRKTPLDASLVSRFRIHENVHMFKSSYIMSVVFVTLIGSATVSYGQPLSGNDPNLLSQLDPDTLAQARVLTDKLSAWQDRVNQAKSLLQPQQIENTIADIKQGGPSTQVFAVFFEINDAIAALPVSVQATVQYDAFQARLAALKNQWATIRDQTHDQIQSVLNQFNAVTALVEHPRLAQREHILAPFLSDEIQQWLKEPRTVDGVTFQILSRPSGSLFAAPSGPGGGMKIEISYQQDITGIVDGVYFLDKAGPASSNRPIDFVTIRMSANAPATSLAATVATNAAARLLGLVPDFGLPIKLKGNSAIVLPNPAGFTKPPTLQVGIEVSVPGFRRRFGRCDTRNCAGRNGEDQRLPGNYDSGRTSFPARDNRVLHHRRGVFVRWTDQHSGPQGPDLSRCPEHRRAGYRYGHRAAARSRQGHHSDRAAAGRQ